MEKEINMQIKVIEIRNRPGVAIIELVTQLKEAFDEGWVIPDEFKEVNSCVALGDGWYRVKLVKEVVQVQTEEMTPHEAVEALTQQAQEQGLYLDYNKALTDLEGVKKKVDMLAIAEEYKVSVPDNIKYPAAVRSYLEKAFGERVGE